MMIYCFDLMSKWYYNITALLNHVSTLLMLSPGKTASLCLTIHLQRISCNYLHVGMMLRLSIWNLLKELHLPVPYLDSTIYKMYYIRYHSPKAYNSKQKKGGLWYDANTNLWNTPK